MAADPAPQVQLTFGDVREFQLQFEAVFSDGHCFVPVSRPLASDLHVVVLLSVASIGEARLEGVVEFNDVDSFGRPGLVVKLDGASVARAHALYARSTQPRAPVEAGLVGANPPPELPFPSVVQPPPAPPAPVSTEPSWGEQVPGLARTAPPAPAVEVPKPPVPAPVEVIVATAPVPPVDWGQAAPPSAPPAGASPAPPSSSTAPPVSPATPSPAEAAVGVAPAGEGPSATDHPTVPLPVPSAAGLTVVAPELAAAPPLTAVAAAVALPTAMAAPAAAVALPEVLTPAALPPQAPLPPTAAALTEAPAPVATPTPAALPPEAPLAATTPPLPELQAPVAVPTATPVPAAAVALTPVPAPVAAPTPATLPPEALLQSAPPALTELAAPVAVPTATPAPAVALTELPAATALPRDASLPPPPAALPEQPAPIAVPVATPAPIAAVALTEQPAPIAVPTATPARVAAVALTDLPAATAVPPDAPLAASWPPALPPASGEPAPATAWPAAPPQATVPMLLAPTPTGEVLKGGEATAPMAEAEHHEAFAATHLFKGTVTAQPAPGPSQTAGMASPTPAAPPGGDELLEPGSMLDNRFQIESHLASGGMGDVYRAQHVYLKRPIALKLLKKGLAPDGDMWARFQREAELVSQLENQHIVRVFDFGRTSAGQPFLAMEFVQGTTLDVMVQQEGPLQPERAVTLLAQVCDGLSEAHALGIIHRDLKPANVIIGKRRDGAESAKILDFGIARIADTGARVGGMLTQMGMVVGTPAYLAPEQALADTLDARTDIYSLGCVAFELLTGRPPFLSDNVQKLVSQHIHEAPPSPASLRPQLGEYPALCEAIQKALSKDRTLRFQDVQSFAVALKNGVQKSAIPSAFDDWPPADAVPVAPVDHWPPPAEVASQAAPGPANPPTAAVVEPPRATQSWPPIEQGRLVESWPPVQAVPTERVELEPPTPRPIASPAPEIDSFFSMDAVASPLPTAIAGHHRLEKALADLKATLPDELVHQVVGRRSMLDGGHRRMVVLHVEVLRAHAVRAACLARVLALATEHDGVVDALDEDGVTLLFPGEEPMIPGTRALFAALAMREAIAAEATADGPPPTLRAGAAFGKVEISAADAPIDGELVLRARTLAARTPPGKIFAERVVAADVDDVIDLGASSVGGEVVEAIDRHALLKGAPVLVGREAHLAVLDKRLGAMATGLVQPLVVVGDSGSGKTSLATELTVRARHLTAVVGMARGLPSLKGQPYSGLAEILCNVCGVPKDQRLTRLQPALEAMKLPAPELEAALVIAGVHHVSQPFTPGQAVYALRAALALGSPGRKVLLVFDDLESMDPYTVDSFRELASRPAAREMTVGFSEAAFAKEAFAQVPTLELKPFGPPELTHLLATTCGAARPSERLVEALLTRSKGLPGLALDWLHLFADQGLLRTRSGALVLGSDAPTLSDDELAEQRVNALWPDARRLFEAACLMGDSIDGAVLNAVLPSTPPAAYQRLAASRMLRAVGGRRWAVASERYRTAALKRPSTHRPMLHQRLATVLLDQARAAQVAPDAALIARHLTFAKDATRALQLWRGVVEGALTRRNPREVLAALRGWGDALGVLLENPGSSTEVARARADTLARAAANAIASGEPLVARALVDEALALSTARKLESAEVALSMSRVLRSEARRAKATEALELALTRAGQSPLAALCFAERAEALEAEGDLPGAAAAFTQALALADAAQDLARWHGEVDFRARVETRLAGVLLTSKDLPGARQGYLKALASWRRTGYPYAEGRVLANLGAVYMQLRDLEDAASCFKEASVCAARAGDLLFQARQLLNLAKVARRFDAQAVARQASDVARRLCLAINWEDGKRQLDALG